MCGQGGKPSEGGGGVLGGPREGAAHHPIWARLYIRRRQPNSLYRPKPNIILLTPPRSHNSATVDVETGSKLIEHRGGEALREDVDELRCRRNMEDANLTDGDSLSYKMKINLHMFGVLMLNRVGGEVHSADVVAVDENVLRRQTLKLMEQLAQLGSLSHAVGDGVVLGFHAGQRDDRLSLG
jgi:hypothetical protein